ncbi:MAG: peptidase, partial [Planctomycetes bacterium]|nr:peptidase [Planctomycetota bacterium]
MKLPALSLLCWLTASSLSAQVPSPREFLGHDIGADHFLADYTQLRAYWKALDEASDRLVVEEFGTTSYGQPMVAAIVSAPQNLARLDEIRRVNRELALGREDDEAAAIEAIEGNPAIVWIDAGMHATESVAAQNILELTWRLTSSDLDEVRRI